MLSGKANPIFMKPDLQGYIQNLKFSKIVALLCLLGFLAYVNAIFHPFVHDDIIFIRDNPYIKDWTNPSAFFTHPSVPDKGLSLVSYYRPLLEIFYRLQYFLFGANPYGYHLFNILIHILNGILAYLAVFLLIDKKSLALGTAALFLVHPVQTEAVACIVGISNLIFSLFCFSSLILYVLARKKYRGKQAVGAYILSLAMYILGLLSKEQAVVLFFLFVLYEFCFSSEGKEVKRSRYLRLSGILAVTLGYFFLRKLILGGTVVDFNAASLELGLRVFSIPSTVFQYLKILVFPVGLHYYRCTDILAPFGVPAIFLGLILGAVAGAVFLMKGEQRRWAIFGLGWFIFSLAPTLNIVPLVVEYSSIMSSEHFLYFPLFGFLIFSLAVFTYFWKRLLKEKGAAAGWFLCGVIVFVFTVVTIKQNTYWQNEITLFKRTLQFEPKLGRVHILLARAYYFNGQAQHAVVEYYKALEIMQGYLGQVSAREPRKFYLQFIKEIHCDLAHSYEAQKDFARVIDEYKQALSVDPADSLVHNNIGAVYLYLKDIPRAMAYFNQALSVNGTDVMAMNNLAICYIEKKEFDKAHYWLKKAVETDARFQPARGNLEKLISSGKLPSAGSL